MAELGKASNGVGQQALAVIARGRGQFVALPVKKRNWLVGGVLMLAGLIASMSWYAMRPDWRTLFSGLEARDVQMVEQELGAAGITYQATSDGGGIEVPAELLDKARIEVATKGMPQTGRLGFELFDKPNWVGSEFDEKVNYQRALEGELEHTIGSLGAVRSARVHLVLPAESLFLAEAKVAKASVVLKLRRMDLAQEQVDSIRRLVAGAVENLDPANVTLVDADGRQDFAAKSGHAREGEADQAMETRLVAMLEPMVGVGNVRTVVNSSYDEGAEERTDEMYDPAQSATLSIEKTEQISGSGAGGGKATGVPGTASNTPAAAPVNAVQGSKTAAAPGVPPLLKEPAAAKEELPVYPDKASGAGSTMKEETATYGVSKHTVHREDEPGRLKRVTVAVLVNDRQVVGASADKVEWKPRSSEEMHRLEGLAQAAVGFDAKRGDTVTVENVSFNSNGAELAPTGAAKVMDEAKSLMSSQPNALRAVMLGGLGLLLITMVLKPVAQQVVATLKAPASLSAGARLSLSGAGVEALGVGSTESDDEEFRGPSSAVVVEQLAEHIRRKPMQSTRLLANWIEGAKEGA